MIKELLGVLCLGTVMVSCDTSSASSSGADDEPELVDDGDVVPWTPPTDFLEWEPNDTPLMANNLSAFVVGDQFYIKGFTDPEDVDVFGFLNVNLTTLRFVFEIDNGGVGKVEILNAFGTVIHEFWGDIIYVGFGLHTAGVPLPVNPYEPFYIRVTNERRTESAYEMEVWSID
jgi:hypothetical protein